MNFIDSDAYIGLYVSTDPHHAKAYQIAQSLSATNAGTITSWDVIDEVATKLSYFTTKSVATKFLSDQYNSQMKIVYVNQDLSKQAIKIFNSQTSKRVSLTDCSNMAIMRQENIKNVFSFDKHYEKNGFKLLK